MVLPAEDRRAAGAAAPGRFYDLDAFRRAISDIPVITDPALVRLKSRDFFWYSPILKEALRGKSAEMVVAPRDEAEVVRIARACAQFRVPITLRGGGTGNYGQAVPLQGGIVLDMTGLQEIEALRPGAVRVAAGKKLSDLDTELRPLGWEQRLHPSTKRTATIGGFVAGGSGGVGSVTYGGLREAGNVLAARIVTLEDEPRILELRDDAALVINHAYGTNGIITALEMALAPAWEWIDLVVAFDDFAEAAKFGQTIAMTDGIVKKLLTPIAWPIPGYFKSVKGEFPAGCSILIAMIAAPSLATFLARVAKTGGTVTYSAPCEEGPGARPLYEFTWNHTTLHALKFDKSITYLQSLFPAATLLDSVAALGTTFGTELLPHLEFIRVGGKVTASGLYLLRFTSPERLNEIIAHHEAQGISVANPHTFTLEDGGRHKRADADQLGFKHQTDPHGLMNPGKMRSFVARP